MHDKHPDEIFHDSKLLEIALDPKIIGLEKIIKCRLEFPIFPMVSQIHKNSFLVNRYKIHGIDLLFYDYYLTVEPDKRFGVDIEKNMGVIDLVLHSRSQTYVVEYKTGLNKQKKKAKHQLNRANQGLPKNYGIFPDKFFYISGRNLVVQEIIL